MRDRRKAGGGNGLAHHGPSKVFRIHVKTLLELILSPKDLDDFVRISGLFDRVCHRPNCVEAGPTSSTNSQVHPLDNQGNHRPYAQGNKCELPIKIEQVGQKRKHCQRLPNQRDKHVGCRLIDVVSIVEHAGNEIPCRLLMKCLCRQIENLSK